jgi:uncharacterized protein YuzE
MAGTKDMKEEKGRELNGKGEMDYDYVNDILFFKIKGREYDRSIEFGNMTIDIDKEEFIVGIQIFDASRFLGINKSNLKINKWQFKAKITAESIELRLFCEVSIRNRIRELSPIIVQQNTEGLPSPSMMIATA